MSGAGAAVGPPQTLLQAAASAGIGILILNSFDERGVFSSFFGTSFLVGGAVGAARALGRGTGVMQGSPTRPKLARPSALRATLPSPATWSRVTGFLRGPSLEEGRVWTRDSFPWDDFSFRFYVTTPSGTYAFDMPMRYGMSVWGIDDDFGGPHGRGPADIPRSFRTRMGHFGWKQLYSYGKTRARAVAAVGMAGTKSAKGGGWTVPPAPSGSSPRLARRPWSTESVGETAEQAYRRRVKQAVSRY